MKKRFLLLLLALIAIIGFTGCKKNVNENASKTNTDTKEIVIKDEETGYKVVLKHPKEDNYEIIKQEGGKFVEVLIKNEAKNIEMDVYFFETIKDSYNSGKENRKESEGFKEYTWNNKEGYIYNASKYSLNFNILLDDGGNDSMAVGLFGAVSSIDYSNANALENFNSKEIQDLLNTIEFSK